MLKKEINCEGCGIGVSARRANQKYCDVCRVLNSTQWLLEHHLDEAECQLCLEKFAPLRRGDVVCGKDSQPRREVEVWGQCVYCEQESDRLIGKGIAVCKPCATKPDNRAKLVRALYKKRKERQNAENKGHENDGVQTKPQPEI